jgi:LysR family transcriptional regulator, glycine cleavage system transcriptional activator
MTVPLVRLSSLDLIRGFVAVGRRMSITQAAEDLCITQSAMSKQIRALEDSLGVRLFQRHHRSISFTPEGQKLFTQANEALQRLQDVWGATLKAREERPISITTTPGVAGLWLSARLGRFQLENPGIEVNISSKQQVVDLKADGVDLAIRYCVDAEAPEGAIRLFGETVAPVASPSLGMSSLMRIEDLKKCILLEFDDSRPKLQWAHWFKSVGWEDVKPRGVLRFNQYDQLISAAVEGQGVALGRMEILAHMLRDGRLKALPHPGQQTPTQYGFWLVQAAPESRAKPLRCVVDWLLAEAEVARSGNVVPVHQAITKKLSKRV